MKEQTGLQPLEYLAYLDPNKFFEIVRTARTRLNDQDFWLAILDDLTRQGATPAYAQRWIDGLKALAENRA